MENGQLNGHSNGATNGHTDGRTNGHVANQLTVIDSRAVNYLLMKLRDVNTTNQNFMLYGDRVMRILAEEAFCRLPTVEEGSVMTPCGEAKGLVDVAKSKLCLVSVVRSGDILLEACRQLRPGVKVGKILIQRDESTVEKTPKLFYKKLPKDIDSCFVILVDPMLATSGSAKMAIKVLTECGVLPQNIMFLNLICAPEGIKALHSEYPEVHIITAAIDLKLDEHKFIVPGLGDYGDRYYGTE